MVTCHCDGLKDAQSQIDLFFAEKEYWDLVEERLNKKCQGLKNLVIQPVIASALAGQGRKVQSQKQILLHDEASLPLHPGGMLMDLLLGNRTSPGR